MDSWNAIFRRTAYAAWTIYHKGKLAHAVTQQIEQSVESFTKIHTDFQKTVLKSNPVT